MSIKLAIAGACGRMGSRIGALAAADKEFRITGALERADHACCGKDYGQVLGLGDMGVKIGSDASAVLNGADALIDFALGEDVLSHLQKAVEKKAAVVIGTTGLKGAALDKIQAAAKSIACVMSPNMSPGVNLLFDVVGKVAKTLGPAYDIEITEMHHRMKKDAPSGTALKLAEMITKETGRQVPIHALRGGDVVGDHVVTFAGDGEMVQLSHRATSRDTFASGALRAAKFAVKAKPGLYTMQDVMRG